MGDPASTWYSSPPWTYLQIKYLTFHNTWDFYWAFGDSSPLSSMIPYPNMQTQIWLFQSQPSTKCVNTFTAVFRSTYCWRDIDKDSNAIITVVVNLNICLWIDDVQLDPPWYRAQWGWHLVFVFNLQLRQHCIYTFSRTMQIHVNHNLYLFFLPGIRRYPRHGLVCIWSGNTDSEFQSYKTLFRHDLKFWY